MKSYGSSELIALMKADGWYEVVCDGDPHHFKHPTKRGKVTAMHPMKDLKIGVLKSIERQAGIKFR